MKRFLLIFTIAATCAYAEDAVPKIYALPKKGVAHIPHWVTHENTVPKRTESGETLVKEVHAAQATEAAKIPMPDLPPWIESWRNARVDEHDAKVDTETEAIATEIERMQKLVVAGSGTVGTTNEVSLKDVISGVIDFIATNTVKRTQKIRERLAELTPAHAARISTMTNLVWRYKRRDGVDITSNMGDRFNSLTNELSSLVRRSSREREHIITSLVPERTDLTLTPSQRTDIVTYEETRDKALKDKAAARKAVFDALTPDEKVKYRAQKSADSFWSAVERARRRHQDALAAWTNNHVMVDGKWVQKSKMKAAATRTRKPELTPEQRRQMELERTFRELSGEGRTVLPDGRVIRRKRRSIR